MLASAIFSELPANPREAAGKLLGDLRLREQTINLSSLILRFRDCDLLEVGIEGDGYCLPAGLLSDKTLVVIPSRGQGEERRRFTLAHELGHLACHYNAHKEAIADEERWCDAFASELLMPKARVDAFARTVASLADWLRFPVQFKVSRTAAAHQLWDYCGVVMVTERLNAKPRDPCYDVVRRQLMALAADTEAEGDTLKDLRDGTPCLIRRPWNQGYVAVAQVPADRPPGGRRPRSRPFDQAAETLPAG